MDELLTGYFLSEDVIKTSEKEVLLSFLKLYNFPETPFFFFNVTQKTWIMTVKPEICFTLRLFHILKTTVNSLPKFQQQVLK